MMRRSTLPPIHRMARPSFLSRVYDRVVRWGARAPQWVQYNQQLVGAYRVAGAAGQYELYVGVEDDPDFTIVPAQTSASLPFSYSVSAPPSGEKEYRLCARWRDIYGLVSLNQRTRRFKLDENGNLVLPDPSGPENIQLIETEDLYLIVVAFYRHIQDGDNRADYWDVYSKVGEDPVPGVDEPDSEEMLSNYGAVPLSMLLGPFDFKEEVHVIVRCRRSGDGEDDGGSTTYTHTMASREDYPLWGGGFGT